MIKQQGNHKKTINIPIVNIFTIKYTTIYINYQLFPQNLLSIKSLCIYFSLQLTVSIPYPI